MSDELQACPHCGSGLFSRVKPYPWDKEGEADLVWGYHVLCDASGFDNRPRGCGASAGWAETPAEAAAAWNKRCAPDGWVIAPHEPTIEMIDAGDDPQFGNGPDIVRHIYQAMIGVLHDGAKLNLLITELQHSRAAEAVASKPLEWVNGNAYTDYGTYSVLEEDGRLQVYLDIGHGHHSRAEAMAVAEDEHRRRSTSPASPSPATGVRVKAAKLHFTNDWLRDKIESDPDLDTEAGGPPILSATVRPLEWRQDHIVGDWFAPCIVGTYLISYCVDDERGEWLEVLRPDGTEIGVFGTDRTDEAKAYAQADYDRVVLSALVEQP